MSAGLVRGIVSAGIALKDNCVHSCYSELSWSEPTTCLRGNESSSRGYCSGPHCHFRKVDKLRIDDSSRRKSRTNLSRLINLKGNEHGMLGSISRCTNFVAKRRFRTAINFEIRASVEEGGSALPTGQGQSGGPQEQHVAQVEWAQLLAAGASSASTSKPGQLARPGEGLGGVGLELGELVGGKYRITGILGQGGVGTMYQAVTAGGEPVAVKAMSLRTMHAWKARVLQSLAHPGIPQYIDYFEEDSATDRRFYLVQKIAPGQSLAQLVTSGSWRPTEEEAVRIACEVLEVLRYLQSLRPAVIHRDIKPENVILDTATGHVQVVDFGAVQDAAATSLMGGTIVGTFGYMAPEQFQNRADERTDLYGLGATLLFLLSGRPPSSFPQACPPTPAEVIRALREPPPPVQQPPPARAANRWRPQGAQAERVRRPNDTKVVLEKSGDAIRVHIPAAGLTQKNVGVAAFTIAWNAFMVQFTSTVVRAPKPLVMTLFSLPFWAVAKTLKATAVGVDISMNCSTYEIKWTAPGGAWSRAVSGKTGDICSTGVTVQELEGEKPVTICEILEEGRGGTGSGHLFGGELTVREQDWIVQEIADFVGVPIPHPTNMSRLRAPRRSRGWSSLNDDNDDDVFFNR
eukprot:jgi/Mesen1/5212/ME000258S04311